MALSRIDYLEYLLRIYILKQGTITKSWKGPSMISRDSLNQAPVEWAYPLDFSNDIKPELLTDDSGIPMIDYASMGLQYNPWFVGHIALGYHSKWKKDGKKYNFEQFIKLAEWFVNTGIKTDNGLVWHYNFDYFGGQKKPWKSGLSQAHGVSTLIRAASITGSKVYSDSARLAINQMITTYDKGGMAFKREDGTISFEEYFSDPPYSVLNGHLFSTFACWEASKYFNDEKLKSAADLAFEFVSNRLQLYDTGFWSKYSLNKIGILCDIASSHYHNVHVSQLEVASLLTKRPEFKEYTEKFKAYECNRFCRYKSLLYKIITKLLS